MSCPVTTPGLTSGRADHRARCPLVIRENSRSLPAGERSGLRSGLDCSDLPLSSCSLQFPAQENSNHYVTVSVSPNFSDSSSSTTVQFAISVDLQGCQLSRSSAGALLVNSINTSLLCGEPNLRPVKILFQSYSPGEGSSLQCGQTVSLLLARRRDSRGGSQFVRTGGAGGAGNVSVTSPLLLSPLRHTVLQFTTDQSDSGGSLAVEIALVRPADSSSSSSSSSLSVSACLSRGYRVMPEVNTTSGRVECGEGRLVRQEGRLGSSPVYEQVLVLYPPPGTWYLSLLLSCPRPASHCSAPVLFSVHTDPCVSGVCGRYGRCQSFLSSTVLYSACSCTAGHRGLACNDPSQAMSDYQLLISSLLLTTSNLAMLPAIMLAAYRGHYTECIVFTAHLIASCLYHACAEQVYSVCVLSLSVLAWSDTFTTVTTIWVTILTIPRLPVTLRSLINMLAVICLAVLVEHTDSLTLTTVIPTLASLVILLVCLVVRCVQTGQCWPSTSYAALHFVPGILLLAASLASSAILQKRGRNASRGDFFN